MKAARLTAIGQIEVVDLHKPWPRAGELLVRVEATGLCGSDRHMFRGEYPTALPVTLGHEFCGIVESVGEGVSRVAPGMRITGDPNIACGFCAACRMGRPNLCEHLTAIGVFRDGGFADYVIVPEGQAHVLPANLAPQRGAFSEPLACCLHALDLAAIVPGSSVAILGGGVIGLLMVQLAKLAGASTIILSTRQAARRQLAERLGATATVDASGDVVAAVRGPGGIAPGGVDVVLECAGVADTVTQSLQLARRGGTVVIFGVSPKGEKVAIEPYDLLVNELRVVAAWLNPLTHARAAAMVASGALELDALVTRTIPLVDLPAVLASAPARGEVKTMVVLA